MPDIWRASRGKPRFVTPTVGVGRRATLPQGIFDFTYYVNGLSRSSFSSTNFLIVLFTSLLNMSEPMREEAERELNELLAKLEEVEQPPVPEKTEKAVDRAVSALESENYGESLEISKKLKRALEAEGERAKGLIQDIVGEKKSKDSESETEKEVEDLKKVEKVSVSRLSILVAIGGLIAGTIVYGIIAQALLPGAIVGVIGGFISGLVTALLYNGFLKDHIPLEAETQKSEPGLAD